ncbi:MAG: hypothetical protein L0287_34220 [Anaerolineae bacterium]|nr:hypothetical protein [Anaerolineae bacterium]
MNQVPETLEKSKDDGINLVNISKTLLHIVAQLRETQYTGSRSTEIVLRQAEVVQHSDLPDPASDSDTSQG